MLGLRTPRVVICVVVLAALVTQGLLLAQAARIDEALVGTWTLDLARSTFRSSVPFYGGTPPASRTMRFERVANGIRHVIETSTAELVERYRIEYTFRIDGRDYPADPQMPIDSVTFRRIDGSTIERIGKTRGQVTHSVTYHLSADGKTLTAAERGTNHDAAGNEIQISSVQVFVRL
jgi:hypothetical protein